MEWETDFGKFQKKARLTRGNSPASVTEQRQAHELPANHFTTGGLGPTIEPTFGFADPYRTDMFDSDKPETSELGQGSFTPTWADSTVPYNKDEENSMLSAISTTAASGFSRECSCITCVELGSRREIMWNVDMYQYECRLSNCNFEAAIGSQEKYPYAWAGEAAVRKHEKDHFRHEGQLRCIEDRCDYGAKRWPDLKRHYTSKHCLNPKTKFPCPEIGCKYGGDNGFTRKDKLKSHRDKVHGKGANTEKRSRVSKPNAQGAA